ncbi:MAG: carboxypeptidase-like regulatory domain-containing protein [Acidobacteriota bacterium]|nr:carboxypeptidase-like regulatory domain-containing protein [Acidobacteriota bacterium]
MGVLCLLLALGACRTGVPILDANPGPPVVMGTITGNVSGEDGTTPVAGRKITAVNLDTSARETSTTSETGGYTFKLPAGRYRVEVELLAGEVVVRDTGEFKLSKSELQHDVDIRIGTRRAPAAGYIYQPPLDNGAPIA